MNLLGLLVEEFLVISTEENDTLIGNNHRNRSRKELEEPVDLNLNLIRYRAYKRLLDILISCIFLLTGLTTIPLLSAKGRKKMAWTISVIRGKKTWVGYHNPVGIGLPPIKAAWTACSFLNGAQSADVADEQIVTANFLYAKNYHPLDDIRALILSK